MRETVIKFIDGTTVYSDMEDDGLDDYVLDLPFALIEWMTIDGIPVTWMDIDSTRIYMCGEEGLFTETGVTI